MGKIFISYRRKHGDAVAFLLHEKLTNLGYKAFYDVDSINNGRFDEKIFEIMDSCDNVIVVLSPNALDRCINEEDWLRKEIAYAIENKKNIIPLVMDGFEWPSSLPDDIDSLRYYNAVTLSFAFFDSVMNNIIGYLEKKAQETPETSGEQSRRHVLMWADFSNVVLDKIIKRLGMDDTHIIEELDDPLELLSRNLSSIDTIVLMVTDCTKFSNNPQVVTRINEALVDYVRSGGRLVCTHDIIYRRTRNLLLQEMYGCQIAYFAQAQSITYCKTEDCLYNNVYAELPERFDLEDCELCWGDVSYDVDIHYQTEDNVPLVFSREYGKGVCIYLHSGDYKFTPPPSIGKPQSHFVGLLRESIKFTY